jgi:hypothetical protein
MPHDAPAERDLGPQPLAALLERHGLAAKDLVVASGEQLTHKMVSRGAKGRWLTPNVRGKLVRALNAAAGTRYGEGDLFDY